MKDPISIEIKKVAIQKEIPQAENLKPDEMKEGTIKKENY